MQNKSPSPERKRCTATTKAGRHCKKFSVPGYDFCRLHGFGRLKGTPWYENAIFLAVVSIFVSILIARHYFAIGPSLEKQEAILTKLGGTNLVILSSERIDLAKKAINNFLVRNIGEIDLYQVTIKLLLESSALSVTNDDIRVDMIDMPNPMEMPIPSNPFTQVLTAVQGKVIPGRDFKDHQGLWIIIDHLPPKTSASFRFSNQSFKALPPGEHCLHASVPFYTNALPANFMFSDGSPGFGSPSFGAMGMKLFGPGKVKIFASARTSQIEGVDIVSNATSLIQAEKWDEAERELTRAIEKNPSLGVAYGNRTVVLMKAGRIEDAYQDSLKALSLLPDDPMAYEHVVQCLLLLGRRDEALTNYNRAIGLGGTNKPRLIYERGVLLSELNRPVEARVDFDQAVLLGYTNEWVRYSKGVAFLKESSFSNAVIEFNAAITIQPGMADAHFALGLALKELGQSDAAERHLREAIRLQPSLENNLLPKQHQ